MITRKWLFLGLILLLILSLLVGCARLIPVQPPAPPPPTLPPPEQPPTPLPPEVDEFPESIAQVTLITPTGQESVIDLEGPTTVHVFFEGAVEGEAKDNDGDGLDEVSTEIVSMELTGVSPMGPVVVRLNPDIPSTGEIEEISNDTPGILDLPPFTTEGIADSFFDVYFELEMGEFVFRTDEPKRMETVIGHKPPQKGDTYENPEWIPLVDLYGQHTGFFVGPAFHTPNPLPPEEPPPAEETLYVAFILSGQCTLSEAGCFCIVSYSLDAEDRSAGDKYPVTNVRLEVNDGTGWQEWHNSGSKSTPAYHYSGQKTGVACGKYFNVRVIATNSIGQTVTATGTFTTASP